MFNAIVNSDRFDIEKDILQCHFRLTAVVNAFRLDFNANAIENTLLLSAQTH